MNRRYLLAALALILMAAALYSGLVWEKGAEDGPPRTLPDRAAAASAPRTQVSAARERASMSSRPGAPVADREDVPEAEARVQELEAVLGDAERRLREAGRALEASEAEVTELEGIIADIKARGEDPADYSDLAMDRFQPAFFRYQDAQAAYDSAERLQAETRAALDAARAELTRARSPDGM